LLFPESFEYGIVDREMVNKNQMRAIIFDMDGVVLDSERHWDKEEFKLFAKLTPGWDREKHKQVVGLNIHDSFETLKNNGMELPESDFFETCNSLAMRIYRTKATVMPGFMDLANALQKKGIPVGLASSSRISWVVFALKKFSLDSFFYTITSSEEIKGRGKPAPDIYWLAASKMESVPSDCVAVEDSSNGVKAAKAAGLFTVGFRNGTNDDQDHSMADMDIRGFTEENNKKILDLFG
jgi:HAD superfamily hydrolase (TIGR01509 family)